MMESAVTKICIKAQKCQGVVLYVANQIFFPLLDLGEKYTVAHWNAVDA